MIYMSACKALSAAALLACAPLAVAGGHTDVNWSISIGSPYPAVPVYAAPQVAYVQPQPVYVQPQRVVVRPQPVYVYSEPVVVQEVGYRHHHHHHGRWRD